MTFDMLAERFSDVVDKESETSSSWLRVDEHEMSPEQIGVAQYVSKSFKKFQITLFAKAPAAADEIDQALYVVMQGHEELRSVIAKEFGAEVAKHPLANHSGQIFKIQLSFVRADSELAMAANGITRVVTLPSNAANSQRGEMHAGDVQELCSAWLSAGTEALLFTAHPSFVEEADALGDDDQNSVLKVTQVERLREAVQKIDKAQAKMLIAAMAATMQSLEAQTMLIGQLGRQLSGHIQNFLGGSSAKHKELSSLIRGDSNKLMDSLNAASSQTSSLPPQLSYLSGIINGMKSELRATGILGAKQVQQINAVPLPGTEASTISQKGGTQINFPSHVESAAVTAKMTGMSAGATEVRSAPSADLGMSSTHSLASAPVVGSPSITSSPPTRSGVTSSVAALSIDSKSAPVAAMPSTVGSPSNSPLPISSTAPSSQASPSTALAAPPPALTTSETAVVTGIGGTVIAQAYIDAPPIPSGAAPTALSSTLAVETVRVIGGVAQTPAHPSVEAPLVTQMVTTSVTSTSTPVTSEVPGTNGNGPVVPVSGPSSVDLPSTNPTLSSPLPPAPLALDSPAPPLATLAQNLSGPTLENAVPVPPVTVAPETPVVTGAEPTVPVPAQSIPTPEKIEAPVIAAADVLPAALAPEAPVPAPISTTVAGILAVNGSDQPLLPQSNSPPVDSSSPEPRGESPVGYPTPVVSELPVISGPEVTPISQVPPVVVPTQASITVPPDAPTVGQATENLQSSAPLSSAPSPTAGSNTDPAVPQPGGLEADRNVPAKEPTNPIPTNGPNIPSKDHYAVWKQAAREEVGKKDNGIDTIQRDPKSTHNDPLKLHVPIIAPPNPVIHPIKVDPFIAPTHDHSIGGPIDEWKPKSLEERYRTACQICGRCTDGSGCRRPAANDAAMQPGAYNAA